MEDHLVGCIRSSLSLGLYENARFLGERLVAANSSEAMSIDTDGRTPLHQEEDSRPEAAPPSGPGAFAAGHTPHMLTFVTPSPAAAPAVAPPLHKVDVTLQVCGGGGGGGGGGDGDDAAPGGQLFPGFQSLPAPPTGSRTPTLGKQKAAVGAAAGGPGGQGANRGRKASKAAGRLFAADSSTPRTPTSSTASHLDCASGSSVVAGLDPDGHCIQSSMRMLLSTFLPLRLALHCLSQYQCREALAALGRLPASQQGSAGVLLLMARCLYELVDYPGAARAFEAARAADPLILEGMELYSTVLWHLKRDVELAHLAQHVLAVDRLAPEAWCVAGNCFSLQREHDSALRLFQRALQLDPHMAYAASLVGHEHLAGEDLGAAAIAYQHALRYDPRHYNAMYGLGQIYLKQEKYLEALVHFEHACSINPSSSVLRCCCGIALRKMNRLDEALQQLRVAVTRDRRNPLARLEIAGVLTSLDQCQDALAELRELQNIVPRESAVHFMMGRLHKRLGNSEAALTSLNTALDLKPAAAERAAIKAAIDKVYMSEDDEEEEL
eukprot:gene6606-6834_t